LPRRFVSRLSDDYVSAVQCLIDGSLDVGFTLAPQSYPAGLTGFIISRQPFWAVLPQGHRLAARKHVTPAMLADEDFIGLPLEMETGIWQNLAPVMPPGKSPRIVQRASDASVILALVGAGIGISILSEAFTRV
jgi:DNA-binding transcriptional LysR family regulator